MDTAPAVMVQFSMKVAKNFISLITLYRESGWVDECKRLIALGAPARVACQFEWDYDVAVFAKEDFMYTPPTSTSTHPAYWRVRIACSLLIFSLATAITSNGQSYNVLTRLVKGDGLAPRNLVQGTDGEFYGVGLRSAPSDGGSIFKVSPAGTVTPIYLFCPRMPCRDGKTPNGLVLASDGNFYGTTEFGGQVGAGTIFQLTPSGTVTTLYNFCTGPSCPSGVAPVGELIQGSDGALYGTTISGGDHDGGTVFRFTLSGAFTTLYSFCSRSPNCADGTNPAAGLLQASNGLFYGTTSRGGATPGCTFFAGCGTLFRISSSGKLNTLYNFCEQPNCEDGMFPQTGLIQATDGKIYGITNAGGIPAGLCTMGCGIAFRIALNGTGFAALHAFTNAEGAQNQNLIQATDGSFYGTAQSGGSSNLGTLFKMTSAGSLTVLYDFCNNASCRYTFSPSSVIQATNGLFYGTTLGNGNGAVFTFGYPPFIRISPASGPIGTTVRIYGADLSGATGVTFNGVPGVPATFTIVSPGELTAIVPAGASTGSVKVTTPAATLMSDVVFHITQ